MWKSCQSPRIQKVTCNDCRERWKIREWMDKWQVGVLTKLWFCNPFCDTVLVLSAGQRFSAYSQRHLWNHLLACRISQGGKLPYSKRAVNDFTFSLLVIEHTVGKDSTTPESYTPSVVIVCPCLPPPSPGEETVSSSLGWFQTMQLTLHFWFSCLHLLESRAWAWTRFLCCWGLNPGLCGAW